MRTNLSIIMKTLLTNILDPYVFQGSDYKNVNQMTFFTSIFPLYFLNSPDNRQILEIGKSNASRLSNLFTRQTDPKRRESKFRERFVDAFDEFFIDDMLLSSRYILRNYNQEAFIKWINELLLIDMELRSDEHMFFYQHISSNYRDKPYIALTLIVLWAFHIDDFKPLITGLEQHPSIVTGNNAHRTMENDSIQPLASLLESYDLSPVDVCDFIDIAYKYGVSSHLGAIAVKTYVDTHTRNNPLISSELADMYFYGNNFRKPLPEKAMNLFMINANMNYGSALWSIGQVSSNEKFDINQMPVQMSMHYYERAIQRNHALSYNNIGKWWLYAMHYHLDKAVGIPDYKNIYANQGRQAISDIYQVMMAKSEFVSFLDNYGLSKRIDFFTLPVREKERLLSNIESAEDFIAEEFIMQAYYKQKYFFALGSCATLYDHQLNRRKHFSVAYGMASNSKREEFSWKKYEYFVKEYVKYQISDSQYTYANYLKLIKAEDQDIYEYLYNAVYETPGNQLNYEALLDFLIYHVKPQVVYKKTQIDFETSLMESVTNYLPNYQLKLHHIYNAVTLMMTHLKTTYMTPENYEIIIELLKAESLTHPCEIKAYDELHESFIEKFKISRRVT